MVFESVVVNLLNSKLGDYVKNLNTSQLKIGIWSGDVVLTNLELKDTALDELDLPIKVVKGFLGRLTLQIPWKNLYSEPTVVKIEDLHILAKPNFDIRYDEEKEEEAKSARKKKEIENSEERRSLEEQRKKKDKKGRGGSGNVSDTDDTEEEDSFLEKLGTNIFKNLQLTIRNIHIRYEDAISDPTSHFSIGLTLENLSAETCDENFKPQIIKESVTIIHKLVRLDNLAVYWNPNDTFSELKTDTWLEFSKQRIARYSSHPSEANIAMDYIMQPMVASKKVKINTKPGVDMSIPKYFISTVLEELGILLERKQYHCMVNLIDSLERMEKNQPYRKFRPDAPLHRNAQVWWCYCISSVLEDVARKRRMWSWDFMRMHRQRCREYQKAYKEKLLDKTNSKELLATCEKYEDELNVASIIIFRQKAENEVARIKEMRKTTSKSKGWFGGWFSSDASKKEEKKKAASALEEWIPSEADREAEKLKLYQAIGYTENEVITPFPSDYIAMIFKFQLQKISVRVVDNTKGNAFNVTCFSLTQLNAELLQRPSSKGWKIVLNIDEMKLLGTPQNNRTPVMIRSIKQDLMNGAPLVDLVFEINPLKREVDQSIKCVCQPLEMIYDAKSISSLFSFFEPPEQVVLQNLQKKAYTTFDNFKETSSIGLLTAMEQRNIIDIDVLCNASYLILPEKGSYFESTEMIVVDFGSLKLQSDPMQIRIPTTTLDESMIEELKENAYDRFNLNLTALQVLLCREGDDLNYARSVKTSHCHILHPVSFEGTIKKAILPQDPRLKQFAVKGELASLEVTVSDGKISRIVKLFESLPMPQLEKETDEQEAATGGDDGRGMLGYQMNNYDDFVIPEDEEITIEVPSAEALATASNNEKTRQEVPKPDLSAIEYSKGIVNQIKYELAFDVKKLKFKIALTDKEQQREQECVIVDIADIQTELVARRWDIYVNANIGDFNLTEMTQGALSPNKPLDVLRTETDSKMLTIAYQQCGFNNVVNLGVNYLYSAEYQIRALQYREQFQAVEKYLEVEVGMLFVMLHQESLLSIMSVIQQVLEPFAAPEDEGDEQAGDEAQDGTPKRRGSNASDKMQIYRRLSSAGEKIKSLSVSSENLFRSTTTTKTTVTTAESVSKIQKRLIKEKSGLDDGISLKVVAKMKGVDVRVLSTKVDLAQITVTGLSSQVEQYVNRLDVEAHMTALNVVDRFESTKYPDIISMESDEVFALKVQMFTEGTKDENALNMSAVDTLVELKFGQLKAIFLNRFVRDILAFLDRFDSAKKAIVDASEAARQKATEVVNELRRHSQRHKLNITLHAPTIIIPVDSKALLAVFVYLGKLEVNNNFKIVNKEDKGTRDYVITDNISISLSELKLSKGLFNEEHKMIAQRDFIEPMCLEINITRNLTFSNHLLPDMSVQAALKSITLYLSEEDIKVMVKVLEGNFAEGKLPSEPQKVKKKSEVNSSAAVVNSTLSKVSFTERKKSRLAVPTSHLDTHASVMMETHEPEVYTKIAFSFDLEEVVLKIYLKPTDIPFEDEFLERDEDLSLSAFAIGHLCVSGDVLSNEEMNVAIVLKTLVLDDTRLESRGKLIRMIDYSSKSILGNEIDDDEMHMASDVNEKDDAKGMLELRYNMDASSDQNITINLCHLRCILNMEFIMTLTSALMATIPDGGGSIEHGDSALSITSSSLSVESSYDGDSDGAASVSSDSIEEEVIARNELKVEFNVRNPQIILLADAKDPKTNALFLTTRINFQYLYLTDTKKMLMNVSDTVMVSTAFLKENRSDISTVLSLKAVDYFSSAPIDGKPHMHMSTTSINLSVSPLTLHTITASLQLAASYKANEDSLKVGKAFSKLWELRSVTEKKSWYLSTPPQHVLSAGSFVLARNEENTYKNGFLSKKDTHFTVFFYPEGQISHSINDTTSVVVDMVPKEENITMGMNVLAVLPASGYKVGRVTRIWKAKKLSVSSEGSLSTQEDWQSVTDNNSNINKYLIHFYHDESECYVTHNYLRILPLPMKGIVPGIGAGVFARFSDGSYYKGVIVSTHGFQNEVYLEELGEHITHDRDDTAAIILNITPQEVQVKKLFKVIAKTAKEAKGFHPGKVLTIMGNPGYYSYYVKFEDGTTNQVSIVDLRLMPKAPYDALPEVGSYVYSRSARESPLYEKGIVVARSERILVNHLNGRKLSHDIQNIGFIVRNIVPLSSSLRAGLKVIAQVDGDEMNMYTGMIKEVIVGGKYKKYVVEFYDGTERKLTAGRIRILSTYGEDQADAVQSTQATHARKEQFVIDVEKISFFIQGYLGGSLTSLLHFESKLDAQVDDWSGRLSGHVNLTLTSTYYNDRVAEWEPMIEPIIEDNHERSWALSVKYVTEDDDVHHDDPSDTALLQKPMTSLSVTSYDNLNITLTKASISLLTEMSRAFANTEDEYADEHAQTSGIKYPYIVSNKLGKRVTIQLNEHLKGVDSEKEISLDEFSQTGLCHPEDHSAAVSLFSQKLPIISVQVEGYQEIKNIVIKRHRVVLHNLVPINLLSGNPYSVVVQVDVIDGRRFVSIRSPLSIQNNFPIPMEVSCVEKDQHSASKLTVIGPNSSYSIPLVLAYHSKFYLSPAEYAFGDSEFPLDWTKLIPGKVTPLACFHPDGECEPFYIQVAMEHDEYTSIRGMMNNVPKYIISCYPHITLHNYLPYDIYYKSKGMSEMKKLEGGKNWPLFTVNVDEKPVLDLLIENYMGMKWSGSVLISGTKGKPSRIISFSLKSETKHRRLELGLFQLQEGTLNVTFYSPYWMLNKTGQTLNYQGVGNEVVHVHPHTFSDPVMFQVKAKKKMARLSILGCQWSDEFSVDTVGSGGSLESSGVRGRIFEIGVRISLSNFALTKIVTFTPLRMINNLSSYTISMAEADSETAEWHTVTPKSSIPYWPTCLPPKNLYININGMDSVKFNPESGKSILLRFQNEIGGVCVTYQEKDSSSLLTFDGYFPGAAPARIENMCKQITMISYKQADFNKGHVLLYGQSVLYTWDDPTKTQELVCGVIENNESQTKIKLDKNDFGRMKAGKPATTKDGSSAVAPTKADTTTIYWVSFLDGIQRVLLFTDNFKAAYFASQEQVLRPSQEINLSIESIGLSLVNAEKRQEVGYISICKSPIVWEYNRKGRWKKYENKMSEALEDGFNNSQLQSAGKAARIKVLDNEVDYEKMFVTKPEKVKIQRTFHSGIEFKYTLFPNRMSISGSMSTLQVDSHMPGSTFLTVIHIVEPPLSVARDNVHKPFIDFSLITKLGEKNVINEVTYFKILVQEMDIRLDTLFLYALMDLFTNEQLKEGETEQYKSDIAFVKMKLESSPDFQATQQEKRYVFNYFHVSPLKIHVSFSWISQGDSDEEGDSSSMHGDILSLLMQSVGLAITEVQDVEFKLACYEINSMMLSSSQLNEGILKHYQSKAIKQLYVLVLGLDVLGNPYTLITGVGEGAKNLFYEPYQGLIQGTDEFVEGLAYGVKGLIGGTVGGVSGAVSRITGTVGKGLARLTMDDEYQQSRRQAMSQRPQNLGQGLLKGGKGLVKGIFSGVTGIVTKPVEGAKADGAEGFFKGIGKGLIGVVARPAGGVVDLASSTFEGLKSTTTGAQTIARVRETRVFHADKILRPYNVYEADGNDVLEKADKGKWMKTDMYMLHVYPVDSKNYLFLTNQHIVYVSKTDLLNDWSSDWWLSFHDIKGEPKVVDDSIVFNLQVAETHLLKKNVTFRTVRMPSGGTVKWFLSKLEDMKLL